MRAVIFANGDEFYPALDGDRVGEADLLIAANGGARHCLALGLTPSVLIGDLDSLAPSDIQRLERLETRFVRYPARKDATDLELALEYAVEKSVDEVLILGSVGDRWDQSLANFLLIAADDFAGVRVSLAGGPQEAHLVRAGERLDIEGAPGDTVSLIPLGGDTGDIVTHGLEYPLQAEPLLFGSTRGLSNVLVEAPASVSLESGMLLCFVTHHRSTEL